MLTVLVIAAIAVGVLAVMFGAAIVIAKGIDTEAGPPPAGGH